MHHPDDPVSHEEDRPKAVASGSNFGMRICLDGKWQFIHADSDGMGAIQARTIDVPGPWQAQFPDLHMRSGTGSYRRDFLVPPEWMEDDGHVFLRFGAVFHNARVSINDAPVGAHEGGFLPFGFDISPYLRSGTNTLTVRVDSPTDDPSEFPDSPLAEIPFGKQSWYGPLSGIWQSVYLELRPQQHIARLRILPELSTGRVRIRIFLSAPLTHSSSYIVKVVEKGVVVASTIEPATAGVEEVGVELSVPRPAAWSPERPHLYTLSVALSAKDRVVDSATQNFGFRIFETRDGAFWLNGARFYMRAALDQDYYPDTICTPPSIEFLEDQFRKAKDMGLNCIRCHIKAPDPRYYEAADKVGILIWSELPNGGLYTEKSRTRKETTLKGIVDRDFNHPSIVCWTIINENWGMDLVHDPEHREWLKRTFHWLKSYDPSRLVVDNSPLAPSFHVVSDIADFHFYAAYPEAKRNWDRFVAALASRPSWMFSEEGDAEISGSEPLMCSEFGNWGLPLPADLNDADGREPWWFETGHDWGEGVMYAHGVANRFSDWSLGRTFGDLRQFVTAAQWQQFRALKYEIEALRQKDTIAGYVITELTDVHWECNGLLDMRRNPRVFHRDLANINAEVVIVPRPHSFALGPGDRVRIGLTVANGSVVPLSGDLTIEALGQTRAVTLPRTEAGAAIQLQSVEIDMPREVGPEMVRVDFTLHDEDRLVARNYCEVGLFGSRVVKEIKFWSPDEAWRTELGELGYQIAKDVSEAQVAVASTVTGEIAANVRAGGRLVLIANEEMSLNPLFPHWQNVRVRKREGSIYRGDWVSTFSWLRRIGPFAAVPGGPLIDDVFDGLFPDHVIAGCNSHDFHGRVHAGLLVGWIHKVTALMVERSYGRGHFVATTFQFSEGWSQNRAAVALMDGMIDLAIRAA